MKIKYYLICLVFGFYNEVYFAPLWNYSGLGFDIAGIPFVAIPGWSIVLGTLFNFSDDIRVYYKLKNFFWIDLILFLFIMAPSEYIMSRAGFWSYNYQLHENVFGMVGGYILVCFLLGRACRYEQKTND